MQKPLDSWYRLSLSPLWKMGKDAYAHFGINCWTGKENTVPFHITNNAKIAWQYAEIAIAAYRGETMVFWELGAGSGRFAYLFISALLRRGFSSFQYILSDFVEKNVSFWNAHPLFAQLIQEGMLKTLCYDFSEQTPLPAVPDFVIANYLFDALPQDLYRTQKDETRQEATLWEGKIALERDLRSASWEDPAILSHLKDRYLFEEALENPYPDCLEALKILENYRQQNIGTFLLPVGAFDTLLHLQKVCASDFLLLTADRGPWTEEQIRLQPDAHMSHHKTFSFPVNFDALLKFVEQRGGEAAFGFEPSSAFGAGLFSLGKIPSEVKKAMQQCHFGPLEIDADDITQIFSRLRLANWDPLLFFSFFERIEKHLLETKTDPLEPWLLGIRSVREQFFPLTQEEGWLFERLGLLCERLEDKKEGVICFDLAKRCAGLPLADHSIRAFLEDCALPLGDVLQIGGGAEAASVIESFHPNRHCIVSWNEQEIGGECFDQIFFFPPKNKSTIVKKPPQIVSDIEKQFPQLRTIAYSDLDIDSLLQRTTLENPEHVLRFLSELEKKGNITLAQFQEAAKKLGRSDLESSKEIRIGQMLVTCLKKLRSPHGMIRLLLPEGESLHDDQQILEEIILNPYLHVEEKKDPNSRKNWVMVKKWEKQSIC